MSVVRLRRAAWLLLLPAAALAAAGGCSKEDLDKLKSKITEGGQQIEEAVSEQLDSATTEAKEQLQLAGSIELQLDAAVQTQACYARFLPQAAGRDAVLQMRSYKTVEGEEFPSVLLQARVQAGSLEQLNGQVLSATLFVQPQADGPVWYCATGNSVEIKINGMQEGLLVAEVVGGSLENTQSGAAQEVTGIMRGVPEF